MDLRARPDRVPGLHDSNLAEALATDEGIAISRAALRRLLRAAGIPSPRRRRAPRYRSRRERMAQAGLLVQVDGSRHDWIEGRGPWLTLMGGIDDATGTVVGAVFREHEDGGRVPHGRAGRGPPRRAAGRPDGDGTGRGVEPRGGRAAAAARLHPEPVGASPGTPRRHNAAMQQPADTRGFRATPSAPIGPDGDRTSTWLPLLQRLTDAEPDWLVLKHPESAFTGTGDIDSAAPRDAWPAIADAFRSWAAEMSLGAVVECPHAPGWLHLVALDPSGGRFWELDVNERKLMLGSTFYRAEDLLALATVDARGFRRVRAGAEGLIKLVHNGTRRGGRENDQGIRAKRIRELLAEDPSGVAAAGRLFGRAEPAARRGAAACVAGRWDRAAMLVVEARFLARVLVEPRGIAWRVRFRLERRSCPLLRAVFAGRRHPLGSPESWLDAVRHTHRVDMPT